MTGKSSRDRSPKESCRKVRGRGDPPSRIHPRARTEAPGCVGYDGYARYSSRGRLSCEARWYHDLFVLGFLPKDFLFRLTKRRI